MEPDSIIEIENFSFSYSNLNVFNNLSLKIEKSSVHGILGANGAGKSTLFNSIFNHNKFDAITPAAGYEKELAYLQTESYFYPYMTGLEYVSILCQVKKTVDIALWNQIFQLPLNEYIHNYSTGMKKKIGLLGTVLLDKKIVLLDEPTNGLDMETCEFFKILVARMRQLGITIILSSHILESIFTTCNRITLLEGPDSAITYEKTAFEKLDSIIKANYTHQKQAVLDQLLPIEKK